MNTYKNKIIIKTKGKGLYKITDQIKSEVIKSKISDGICFLFVPHTSASITIQEIDPASRDDMQYFLEKLVPEIDKNYKHCMEGRDDSSSHIKGSILNSSQVVFVEDGNISLGTWQDIYLWEHRIDERDRIVSVRIISEQY